MDRRAVETQHLASLLVRETGVKAMTCGKRQRADRGRPAGVFWGFLALGLLSLGLAGETTDSAELGPLEQALATVQDCLARSSAPWPDAWQREYLATVREALSNDPNRPDYPARIEIFQRGFLRYWGQVEGARLTPVEYDLRKAEMRWYCETLMAEGLASASEKAILKGQLAELCDYATEYLKGRFPFLKPECVEAAKKAVLAEFDQEVDSPLLPIFRRPLSEDRVRAVKASWLRLYRRWHFICREVRYGGGGRGDLSDSRDLTSHAHYRLARRCLSYLPRIIWPTLGKPPGYVLEVVSKLSREKTERGRINRQGADAERELAMRSSNQVEQVEEWSFIFTALLETASTSNAQGPSSGQCLKGGDAYDLKKQP